MIAQSNFVDSAADQLGAALPGVLAAILLLVVGLLVARLVGRLLRRGLQGAGLDNAAERWGVTPVLERAGLGPSLAKVIGRAARVGLSVVVVFAALSLLGLQFLSESLNQGVLFVPKLMAALALILIGLVLGAWARERLERTSTQLDLPVPLGPVAQAVVIAIFAITAAAQLTISIALLLLLVAIVLAGAVATLTISFGLDGREVARSLSAARYVRSGYEVGQTVRIGDVRGTIRSIDSTTTVLSGADGVSTVRVPNRMLLEELVLVEAGDGNGSSTPA